MISVEEAIKIVKNSSVSREEIIVGVKDSLNFVLAESIYSPINIPSFQQSAMDGYAVCGELNEFILKDEIQAGDTRILRITTGEACRIFTGAPVPSGATAVIMQEKAENVDGKVSIHDDIVEGKNIRPIGEQIKATDLVFEKGQKLNPSALGLLQGLGIKNVKVYKNPAISLIVTGDELKPLDAQLNHGEIYESNSITLISAAKQSGFIIGDFNHVVDNYENTKNIISKQLDESDVLLLSGGISVGDYDFVKKALTENGVQEIFYKVKQKPGKPLFFGKKDQKYVFALPGNPAAALTCYYIYVLPLLKKLKGERELCLESRTVQLDKPYLKKGNRAVFLKGYCTDDKVRILDGQSSAMLHSYSLANCLIYIPENVFEISIDDNVKIYRLPY